MLALTIGLAGIGMLCWLLFALAIYALPAFIGAWIGIFAYRTGAGIPGAAFVGLVAGSLALMLGQYAFGSARSAPVRMLVAALFAIPAGVAGYHAVLGIAHLVTPSPIWSDIFAAIGALMIGSSACARLVITPTPARFPRQNAMPIPQPPLVPQPQNRISA